jgi:hypothetical protein
MGTCYFCIVNTTVSNVFSDLSHEITVDFEAALIAISAQNINKVRQKH